MNIYNFKLDYIQINILKNMQQVASLCIKVCEYVLDYLRDYIVHRNIRLRKKMNAHKFALKNWMESLVEMHQFLPNKYLTEIYECDIGYCESVDSLTEWDSVTFQDQESFHQVKPYKLVGLMCTVLRRCVAHIHTSSCHSVEICVRSQQFQVEIRAMMRDLAKILNDYTKEYIGEYHFNLAHIIMSFEIKDDNPEKENFNNDIK